MITRYGRYVGAATPEDAHPAPCPASEEDWLGLSAFVVVRGSEDALESCLPVPSALPCSTPDGGCWCNSGMVAPVRQLPRYNPDRGVCSAGPSRLVLSSFHVRDASGHGCNHGAIMERPSPSCCANRKNWSAPDIPGRGEGRASSSHGRLVPVREAWGQDGFVSNGRDARN